MTSPALPHDPNWVRANTLFTSNTESADVALIGVPAREESLSPTSAHQTPDAIRGALARYSTYSHSHNVDLREIETRDLGNVISPEFAEGEQRVAAAVKDVRRVNKLLIALGGDNSITYSVVAGIWPDLAQCGLITLDAHHDLRDGRSSGSPVWRLIQAGIQGSTIVQIGISDFANSKEYAVRAKDHGIHIFSRELLRKRPIADVMLEALEIAGGSKREIYVDIDVDVCDRSVAPACPASVPGGISADELRQAAFLAGASSSVRAIDITEIDAASDTPDQRTIRLGALLVLEAACGVAKR
ncbi:MAG: agmatinase family protein [Candidatus Nanopelagicaceae bacterium]|nr:agmatinase family protein [Candidatus Nanopelagicaceae bacterium]